MKMLKKSLIAVAILAIVLPAMGATTTVTNKYHKNWPGQTVKTWNWQDVKCIDVVMDVGYWIEVKYDGVIEVQQDAALASQKGKSVFECYSGCLANGGIDVYSNFHAALKATASSKSDAGGTWEAEIGNSSIYEIAANTQYTDVSVCVKAWDVKIKNLNAQGGVDNLKVAEVCIKVIPWDFRNSVTTTFGRS
jgi:hypothetical protein